MTCSCAAARSLVLLHETLEKLRGYVQHKPYCKRPRMCPATNKGHGLVYFCAKPVGHEGQHEHEGLGAWAEEVVVCTCGLDTLLAAIPKET